MYQNDDWYGYAELCLFLGEEEEYCRARQVLLRRFGATTDPHVAERTARACLLLPAAGDELRQAVALAERAAAAEPSKYQWHYPRCLFARGLAEYRRGRLDRAVSLMRGDAARVLGPAPRLVLAMAQHKGGQEAEARTTLAAAILGHDWRASRVRDQDDWLCHALRREAEGLILPNLPAFLEGGYEPRENDERVAFLGACEFTNRTRTAAALFADAFAAAPALAKGSRYTAACCAALAGSGRGSDAAGLSESGRVRWRKQARDWLTADLAEWTRALGRGEAGATGEVRKALAAWQADPDLAGLREPGALAKLSAEEREESLALWREVWALLGRTAAR